jgi:hypothetical protein
VLGCGGVLTVATTASLWDVAIVTVVLFILIVPLGYVAARWVLPTAAPAHVRMGLALGLGYILAPPILVRSTHAGLIGLLAPPLLALVGALVFRKAFFALRPFRAVRRAWSSEVPFVLAIIVALSVAVVTPLMSPLRPAGISTYANYAYIDSFFHLNLVQRLMTTVPLQDWPNMAGSAPLFYQDFHHILLATVARLSGLSAGPMFFLYAPIALVSITIVLAYAVGRSLTRSRIGGYIAAALQYIVLIPNVYDRNWLLENQWSVMLPNFYQIHFYDLRYAQHAASGWIAALVMVLIWVVALRTDDRRTVARTTLAGCVLFVVLFMFRPQYALMMAVPSVAALLWLSRQRRALLLGAALVGVASFAWVLYPYDRLQSSSAGLIFKYGVFAARASRVGYYLPNVVTHVLGFVPDVIRPAVGLAAIVGMRIIGLNLLVVMGLGARSTWRVTGSPLLARPEAYLWMAIGGAFLAALFLEQPTAAANIGWNILQGMVLPALLLASVAVVDLVGRARLHGWWERYRPAGLALAVVLSLIAHRGAEALLHERPDRAYSLTAVELDAYAWVRTHTPATAVIAADPNHRVNFLGETVRSTAFLSGMTERSAFVQYVSAFTRTEGDRRVALLDAVFDTHSEAEACRLVRLTGADYWIEYADRPFAAGPLSCLQREFQGNPNVYRTVAQ